MAKRSRKAKWKREDEDPGFLRAELFQTRNKLVSVDRTLKESTAKLKEMCEAFDRQQDEIARLKGLLDALSLMAKQAIR